MRPVHTRTLKTRLVPSAVGMTTDTPGRRYVTTHLGVQFGAQAGRVNGIIAKPQNQWIANVVFGGANLDELYGGCSDKVYKRKTQVKSVLSLQPPSKPPRPRLCRRPAMPIPRRAEGLRN